MTFWTILVQARKIHIVDIKSVDDILYLFVVEGKVLITDLLAVFFELVE